MESSDRTTEIAGRYADQILSHEKIEGFDAGRQKAFEAATGDWIFSLDADEVATPELGAWIRQFVDSDPPYDVALIPRANVYLGRWLRSTSWWPGKPRLFRKGMVQVTPKLHKGLVPLPTARIARLPQDPDISLWHFTMPTVSGMVDRSNRYTSIEARQALAAGAARPGWFELMYEAARGIAPYVLRRGYRDGMAGLVYAIDQVYYRWLAVVKRWDEVNSPTRQPRYDRQREEILSRFPARADEALPADTAVESSKSKPKRRQAAATGSE
jgi:glycosyltransferase involved in cell wall biosynthesis